MQKIKRFELKMPKFLLAFEPEQMPKGLSRPKKGCHN